MENVRLTNFIAATALAIGSLIASMQADASVVCFGDEISHVATHCTGVVYNSTTYVVTWVLPDYPTTPLPIFSGGTASADAQTVAGDIDTALNVAGLTNIEYATGASTTDTTPVCSDGAPTPCYYVPYRINVNDTVSTWESRFVTGSWSVSGNPSYPFATQNQRPVAVFTPVPLPAALTLFLSGVAAIGWMVRRRRQEGC